MSFEARKITAGIGLVLILFLVFLVGRWTGGSPSQDRSEVAEVGAPAAETIWTCSMHPQVRQPNPGKCPICGMDLIPVAADDDPDDDGELPRLRVSERSAALMNIQTWPVERRVVDREVRLLGRIDFDETRLRTITAWVPGRIERLFVDVAGARVQQGDPIAEIYSPALISAQEELLQALRTQQARGGQDTGMVRAARGRLRLLGLEVEQILELESRGSVQDRIVIHSPLNGVILERIAVEGTYVEAGDRIAELADLDRICIDLEAYESDLPWLAVGQMVQFTAEGVPGETYEGRIAQINPFIAERMRTSHVRIFIENPDQRLLPGMFARAVVSSSLGGPDGLEGWREQPPLVIPATAALITGRRAVVYVKIAGADRPTFEARTVNLGPRAGDYYVVADGLEEGELVVTRGAFKIDSELQIRGRPSMMAPEGGAPPVHDHGAGGHTAADPREKPVRQDFAEPVDPEFAAEAATLVTDYLKIAQALASDDSGSMNAELINLREKLVEIGKDRLSGDAHAAWVERHESLNTLLQTMGSDRGIEEMRAHFQDLSLEIEGIHLNFGGDRALHRAYCPMANNDRGATWLQADKEINNPYFGASMLRCGEILADLPGK